MAKPGWYLEKKGKFYGPFTRQKIQQYFDGGKITDQTPVSLKADGSGAVPFADIDSLVQKAKAAKTSPPPREPTPAAPAPGALPTHFFLQESDRSQGPFELEQLGVLYNTGKIKGTTPIVYPAEGKKAETVEVLLKAFKKPDERVASGPVFLLQGSDRKGPFDLARIKAMQEQHEIHAQTLVDFGGSRLAVLTAYQWLQHMEQKRPSAPERTSKAGPPRVRPDREPRGVDALGPPKRSPTRVFSMLLVVALAAAAVAGVFVGWQKYREKTGPAPIPEKPKSLRDLMRVRELPNFNALVLPAVQDALNIPLKQVKRRFAPEQPITEKTAPDLDYQIFVEEELRRETRFRVDGPFDYTYLSNKQGFVVGIAIEGPNFSKLWEQQFKESAFAPGAMRLEGPGRIIWRALFGQAVVIEVHWRKGDLGYQMAFILVKNHAG